MEHASKTYGDKFQESEEMFHNPKKETHWGNAIEIVKKLNRMLAAALLFLWELLIE